MWQDISGGDDGYIPLTDHRRSIVGTWSKNGERMDELARYTPQGRVTRKDYDESNLCQERGNPGTVCSGPSGMPFGFNSMWRLGAGLRTLRQGCNRPWHDNRGVDSPR